MGSLWTASGPPRDVYGTSWGAQGVPLDNLSSPMGPWHLLGVIWLPGASWCIFVDRDGCSSTMPAIKIYVFGIHPRIPRILLIMSLDPPRDLPSTRSGGQDDVSSDETPSKYVVMARLATPTFRPTDANVCSTPCQTHRPTLNCCPPDTKTHRPTLRLQVERKFFQNPLSKSTMSAEENRVFQTCSF